MTLESVFLQHLAYLGVKGRVAFFKAGAYVLVYRAFAYAVFCRRGADGAARFQYLFSQAAGAAENITFHTEALFSFFTLYVTKKKKSTKGFKGIEKTEKYVILPT